MEKLIEDTTSAPTWSSGNPEMIVRKRTSYIYHRLDSSAELNAPLYQDEQCPFTEEVPCVASVGMQISLWDKRFRSM
jgi:hypothetical protein